MAKQKTTFLLDSNDWLLMEEFTIEQKAEMLTVIFQYAKNYDMPEIIDPFVRQAFKIIKLKMDTNLESYKAICKKRKESIAKRWKGDTNVYKCIEEQTKQNADTKDTDMICNDMICNDMICNDMICNDSDMNLHATNVACTRNTAKNADVSHVTRDKTPYKAILNLFNSKCQLLPRIRDITGNRQKMVKQRWQEHPDLAFFESYFDRVSLSDFLTGRNDKFTANFDWLMKPANMTKVLDGNYDNREKSSKSASGEVDQYDMDGFHEPVITAEDMEAINARIWN